MRKIIRSSRSKTDGDVSATCEMMSFTKPAFTSPTRAMCCTASPNKCQQQTARQLVEGHRLLSQPLTVVVGCTVSKDFDAGGATPLFSAVQTPLGPRKSETPALVEMPAPVSTTQLLQLRMSSASLRIFLLATLGSSSFSGSPSPGAPHAVKVLRGSKLRCHRYFAPKRRGAARQAAASP
jgi:hypothetical protein